MLDELGIQMGEEMGGLVVPTGQIGAAERTGPAKVPIGGTVVAFYGLLAVVKGECDTMPCERFCTR